MRSDLHPRIRALLRFIYFDTAYVTGHDHSQQTIDGHLGHNMETSKQSRKLSWIIESKHAFSMLVNAYHIRNICLPSQYRYQPKGSSGQTFLHSCHTLHNESIWGFDTIGKSHSTLWSQCIRLSGGLWSVGEPLGSFVY